MFACPVQQGELVDGRYRVGRVLGQGGMGVVVQATDIELQRSVAIKFLLSERLEDDEAFQRFRREARATAQILSEYAVRVYDSGRHDQGAPFLVMEWLNGKDLAAHLHSEGTVPTHEAVDFALQACEGLAVAHSLGIVHRDIKPGNLFVEKRADGTRRLKLLDFGLAKPLTGETVTASQHVMGSPAYMSPEQIRAPREVGTRSDIWSIGAVLFELLTGRRPFQGDTALAVCAAILSTEPRFNDDDQRAIPDRLRAAVMRCLAREQAERFVDVAALADALAEFGGPTTTGAAERARNILDSDSQFADFATLAGPSDSNTSLKGWAAESRRNLLLSRRSWLAVAALGSLGLGAWWWLSATHPLASTSDSVPQAPAKGAPANSHDEGRTLGSNSGAMPTLEAQAASASVVANASSSPQRAAAGSGSVPSLAPQPSRINPPTKRSQRPAKPGDLYDSRQ